MFHSLRYACSPKRTLLGKRRGDRGVHEKNVAEFYGWIGRRALFHLTEDQGVSPYFPEDPPKLASRERVGSLLRGIRTSRRKLRRVLAASDRKSQGTHLSDDALLDQQAIEALRGLEEVQLDLIREHFLHHYRGYRFADSVDLSRIQNWRTFLSLPDREVRRRFFTDTPDYSGLGNL